MDHDSFAFAENTMHVIVWTTAVAIVALWDPSWAFLLFGWIVFSLVWFWRSICAACPNVLTGRCPSKFNLPVRRFFGYKPTKDFKGVFYRNIWVIFPWWFAPLIAATLILMEGIDWLVIALVLIHGIFGFVLIPYVSKRFGCEHCSNRRRCPWKNES